MTVEEIKNLSQEDISKLNKEELLSLTREARKKMTDRINKLNKSLSRYDIPLPTVLKDWGNLALEKEKRMTKYGILKNRKNVNYTTLKLAPKETDKINTLRYKFKFIQDFLKSKTSLYSGWKKTLEDFYRRIGGTTKLQGEEYKKLWEIYNEARKNHTLTNYDSSQAQRIIYELYVDKKLNFDEIMSRLSVGNEQIEIDMWLEDEGYDENWSLEDKVRRDKMKEHMYKNYDGGSNF